SRADACVAAEPSTRSRPGARATSRASNRREMSRSYDMHADTPLAARPVLRCRYAASRAQADTTGGCAYSSRARTLRDRLGRRARRAPLRRRAIRFLAYPRSSNRHLAAHWVALLIDIRLIGP